LLLLRSAQYIAPILVERSLHSLRETEEIF
jgi:hypothetical protein